VPSVDGATPTKTLDANYSDLDPTYGAGTESAAFGRMHLDGLLGSTNARLDGSDPFLPSSMASRSGSLASNLGAPGGVDFDCFSVLHEEGQLFIVPITTTARAPVRVVFAADLRSLREQGRDWEISFGGRVSRGSTQVAIEFSTDGEAFTSFATVTLTEVDSPFRVKLGSTPSQAAYVRLGFEPETERRQQAFLDNVAIHAALVASGAGADPSLPSGLARLPPAPQVCPPLTR